MDVGEPYCNGNFPIHVLVANVKAMWSHGNSLDILISLIESVVERGANINQVNWSRQTPLMTLLMEKRPAPLVDKVLQSLRELGANPWVYDSSGNF